jgi:glycerate-2-kinase
MDSKTLAREIFSDALEASLPKNFISKHCRLEQNLLYVQSDVYNLDSYKNIYVFGSGKASFTMAQEIEKLLGERIHKGLIVAPKTDERLKFVKVCEGSHPLPSQKSFDAACELMEMMKEVQKEDLFIYLLSGGSSALIELPLVPISLEEFQKTTELMLHNALEIQEINAVRKHISQIKGGRLAQNLEADGVVLVLSDILGDDLYSIGSAPLYADKSSFAQAKETLQTKKIFHLLPLSVQNLFNQGCDGEIDETPKSPKENIKHYLLASNTLALNAAKESATKHGLSVKIANAMQGDVDEMIKEMLKTLQESEEQCILFGGECTVKVTSENGQGGRNQHSVALMLEKICQESLDICFLSAGTDGIDGNSNAAGAVVSKADCSTIKQEELQKYIKEFDTHNFFKKLNALVMTGASGTNVIDIAIIIKGE